MTKTEAKKLLKLRNSSRSDIKYYKGLIGRCRFSSPTYNEDIALYRSRLDNAKSNLNACKEFSGDAVIAMLNF